MTESEMHLVMTSGKSFCEFQGLILVLNHSRILDHRRLRPECLHKLGCQDLITASIMSIPASIAISKVRVPELEEPVTRGESSLTGEDAKDAPVNALHAFGKGAVFGLVVAGQILCNVLTLLSLVGTINGLLTWIGRGFGIHHLTLQLVLRYVFYPVTFPHRFVCPTPARPSLTFSSSPNRRVPL